MPAKQKFKLSTATVATLFQPSQPADAESVANLQNKVVAQKEEINQLQKTIAEMRKNINEMSKRLPTESSGDKETAVGSSVLVQKEISATARGASTASCLTEMLRCLATLEQRLAAMEQRQASLEEEVRGPADRSSVPRQHSQKHEEERDSLLDEARNRSPDLI